jgi:predicted RNA-binding Zn-ribbon protein involved in translation (DUF1610 family)
MIYVIALGAAALTAALSLVGGFITGNFMPALGIIAIMIPTLAAMIVVRSRVHVGSRDCPQCGAAMPAIRRPTSMRQALLGGWTCPACGCEMDRQGRVLTKSAAGSAR